jgi:hypothetical protein
VRLSRFLSCGLSAVGCGKVDAGSAAWLLWRLSRLLPSSTARSAKSNWPRIRLATARPERILTSVFVEKHAPHRPEEIVLHSPPLPLTH